MRVISVLVVVLMSAAFNGFANAKPQEIHPFQIIMIPKAENNGTILITMGQQRSAYLVNFLAVSQCGPTVILDWDNPSGSDAMRVASIYVSNSDVCSTQTINPMYLTARVRNLADYMNLPDGVIEVDAGNVTFLDQVISDPSNAGKTVLLCWDRESLPSLISNSQLIQLGNVLFPADVFPSSFEHTYDALWVVRWRDDNNVDGYYYLETPSFYSPQ